MKDQNRKQIIQILFLGLVLLLLQPACKEDPKSRINKISTLQLPGVTITEVQRITGGSFTPEGHNTTYTELPDFVRVAVSLQPVEGSTIHAEVWLPENREDWNNRFLGTGNGAGGGRIRFDPMAAALKRGFAAANTDLGTHPHANSKVGVPESWVDFGYRATHEMTICAKKIIRIFYGRKAKYAYFVGCSTGGQQGLAIAQRYPGDYDGYLVGAPGNNRTHLHTQFLWNYVATNRKEGCKFTSEQLNTISSRVIAANVGKDGGHPHDKFLTDPRMARFDPDTLKGVLTSEQLETLKKIYSGPINPITGEQIYTSLPLGSENIGAGIRYQQGQGVVSDQFYLFRWVFGNEFDPFSFDFNEDLDRVNETLGPILNANNPDLNRLRKSGGKIIMYTGTLDAIVPLQDAVNYYERVIDSQSGDIEKTHSFFRYFLVPGMLHCSGGPGLNFFGQTLQPHGQEDREYDIFIALMEWVEKGIAPQKIIASSYEDGNPNKEMRFQRPVYPYPMFPHYTGGDPNQPSSYNGVNHDRKMVIKPSDRYLKIY